MASEPERFSLESLTEDQHTRLCSALPPTYQLDQYLDDLNQLQDNVAGLIEDGKGFVQSERYGLAGTVFTDVYDLQRISFRLSHGELCKARSLVDNL